MDKEDIDRLAEALALPRGHYLKQVPDPDNPGKQNWITCVGRTAAGRHSSRFGKAVQANGYSLGRKGPGGKMRQGLALAELESLSVDPPAFDGVYPDGRVNVTKAAADSGWPKNFLRKCVIATTYLPEGKLPSLKQRPPGARYHPKEEHTVLPADVARLRKAVLEAARIKPPAGWKDAADICQLVGAKDLASIIFINARLKEGRDSRAIGAWRPDKPIKIRGWDERKKKGLRGGGKRRPWFYEPAAALEFIRNGPANGEEQAAAEAETPARVIDGQERAAATTRRGPSPNPDTEAMSEACYGEYVTNRQSRKEALKAVRKRFPNSAPSSTGALYVYAKRYAGRHGLPWRE